jgi:LysR family transcriptional regulator, transcriptional activator of nhaA
MDWLNFHHLRYFWVVAKEGSLRAAAERLNVSQPSISAQLRLLEESLGHPLFNRDSRGLQLTDTGRLVLEYSEEIFATGRELLHAVRQSATERPAVFQVGITDSLPKFVARKMLHPALALTPAPRLICREGQLDELLPLLATHRLDLVLADEPVGAGHKFKVFNHPLGSCGVTFCAEQKLAAKLKKGFPKSLHGAPALLPVEGSSLRREIERWFHERGIEPRIAGEFDDAALMMFFAREGLGFLPLHSVAVEDARRTLQLAEIGDAPECRCHLHAITVERRLKQPAVLAVTTHAQEAVFG